MALGLLLNLPPAQARALSLSLSVPQIEEAVRYGEQARDLPLALMAREWRTDGLPRPGQRLTGSAWLQSPFALIARASWAASHRGLALNATELQQRLEQVRDRLAFAVTLALPLDFPRTYEVTLHQAGEVLVPSYLERREELPEGETAWAYLYCLFPAEGVDLNGTVVLVVTDDEGHPLPFVFDLSRMR
jgi:hypothetical protein